MIHHRRLLVLFIYLTFRLEETASIYEICVAVVCDFIQRINFSLLQKFNKLRSKCEQKRLLTIIHSIRYFICFQLKLNIPR